MSKCGLNPPRNQDAQNRTLAHSAAEVHNFGSLWKSLGPGGVPSGFHIFGPFHNGSWIKKVPLLRGRYNQDPTVWVLSYSRWIEVSMLGAGRRDAGSYKPRLLVV